MKRWSVLLPFAVSVVLVTATLVLISQPSPSIAGGLPCFLCHGTGFQGSDIAPSVADTKLSDEEIIKQIRSPRGLMPAFPEFADQSIVDLIRSMPKGQPTASLSSEQRSVALATIAAVAEARATAFAQLAQQETGATPTLSPSLVAPASTPTLSGVAPAMMSSSPTARPTSAPVSLASTGVLAVVGGLLAAIGGAWWIWRRR